jgi:hypothetical protein
VRDFSGRILAERRKVGTTQETTQQQQQQQQQRAVFLRWLYKYSQKAILKMKTTKSSVEFFGDILNSQKLPTM